MIVQCEACETRFRLADEKIKAGGTKVRCSKCKQVFTVLPAEPEPAEGTVDFGSFNMEQVNDDEADNTGDDTGDGTGEESAGVDESFARAADHDFPAEKAPEGEVDFSALEQDMDAAGYGDELADDFSFADTSKSSDDETEDIADAFQETPEPSGPVEFAFDEDSDEVQAEAGLKAASAGADAGDSFESGEFAFDDTEETPEESTGSFAFGDPDDSDAFSFGDEDSTAKAATEEFSIDDENPFGEEAASEWGEESAGDGMSFDFDEPSFESSAEPARKSEEGGLQFGEIDFSDDEEPSAAPAFDAADDFSKASLQPKLEMETSQEAAPQRSAPKTSRDPEDRAPLPVPAKTSKGPLSRVVTLLLLLLLALGGAAGYLYMQEGALNLSTLTRYLPFLQDYIGEVPAEAPSHQIGINISGSSYVNGKAGQLLVIQGAAVNNHSTTRSAITIKGVLLDASGQSLLQQTVFCGNFLGEDDLKTMPFTAIEEAMNNQFGDSLSNMNVAAGASIPFTIVFRNLPTGIANINVEVVDSKPGVR